MPKWDVIVVGSGISGLVCGAILAKRGRSVCVLEQHTKVGGYLHCFKRHSRRFDTGGHYVGAMAKGDPFHTLLTHLGLEPEKYFVPLDQDGFDELLFPDFRTSIPASYEKWEDRLAEIFPKERQAVRAIFGVFREAVRHFPTYEFATEFDANKTREYMETDLQTVVESYTQDPRLKAVFFSYCALHGVMPKDIGVGFHSLVVDSLMRGAYGFRSGGDALAQAFVEKIESAGGQVRTHSRVVAMPTEDGRIRSVQLENGEELSAEWIISSAHPRVTFGLTGTEFLTPAFRSRIARMKESIPFLGIYSYCNADQPISPLKNYYCFDSYDPERWLEFGPEDRNPPMVYLMRPDRTAPVNEAFALTFHGACHPSWFEKWSDSTRGARSPGYDQEKKLLCGSLLDLTEKYFPGMKQSIRSWDGSTNLTNRYYNGTLEGSGYGIYHSIQNTGVRALGPQTHIDNLLLTGQSTLFPGLLGASISGLRTAGRLVGIKNLIGELVSVRGGG